MFVPPPSLQTVQSNECFQVYARRATQSLPRLGLQNPAEFVYRYKPQFLQSWRVGGPHGNSRTMCFFFGNTTGFTCCSELCCQFCATKTRGAKETQSCKLSLETSHKVAPATKGQMLLVWSATWRHANRSCVWWFGNPSSSTRHLRGEQSGVHSEYQVPTSHMPPGKEWDKLASAWQNKKCATLPHICRNWKARTIMHTHTHLLRTIFANSDVECILRAKTFQLYLTGMGRRKDPRSIEKFPSP